MTFHNVRFLPTTRTKFQIGQILDGRFKLLADQIDSGVYKLTKLKDYDDREKFFFPAEITSSKWTLILVFPASYIARDLHSLLIGFAFALIISLVVSMIVVFFLINGMLKPVMELTNAVKQFGEKKMNVRCEISSNDEIGELGRSFNSMAEIIQDYSLTLEEMVESRTKELSEKNRSIQDSIEYAGMIQQTILPDEGEMNKIFKEYFVIWNPRDIVGGDFYWMKKFAGGFVIAVGDCTGHGVPGALMTMAVSSMLDSIADDICNDDPAFMLHELNRSLIRSLRKEKIGTGVSDGLDAGILCVLDSGKILYCGARISLFIIQNGEMVEIQGIKHTIGTELKQKSFVNQEIVFSTGMSLYLATDGIKDQVGGERHIPFGKKRLIDLLKSMQEYSMDEQKNILWSAFSDYMKYETPRDDITVLGFRL
jgi:serine phosphatase RsbU (regulator of sigma subunit)/HAMP domain-containing protein